MESPCNGCKRRKVGCHNVETCKAWREYVAANKEKHEKNMARNAEKHQDMKDFYNHLRRHGTPIKKGKK